MLWLEITEQLSFRLVLFFVIKGPLTDDLSVKV